MKQLHYQVPNNLSVLHDELLAAIPSLSPILNEQGVGTPVMAVEGIAGEVWLTVPDGADETAIAAIVTAHDSNKVQPDLRKDRLARIAEMNEIPQSDWTENQMREFIALLVETVK